MAHKYLKEDDTAYVIQHPDGSHFKVAKKGLGKGVAAKIEALKPKGYADGGEVELDDAEVMQPPEAPMLEEPTFEPAPMVTPTPMPSGFSVNKKVTAQDEGAPLEIEEIKNSEQPMPVSPNGAPTPAPVAPNPMDQLGGAYAQQQQATKNIGAIESQRQKQLADDMAANQVKEQESAKRLQALQTQFNTDDAALRKDISEKKIDPNKLWSSMGAANKIGMAISFILGGISQGMLKSGNNQAVTMFNKMVDDDIASQKAELGKKENLLSQNMAKFKDNVLAEQMTRTQLQSAFQAQLQQRAAQSGSKLAIQQAKLANGQIEEEKQKNIVAMAAAKAKAMEAKTGQFIPQLGAYAQSPEVAQKINQRLVDSNKASSGLNSLLAISQMTGKSFSPEISAKASTEALMLQGALKEDIVGSGTVSDSDRAMLKAVVADPTVLLSMDRSNIARLQTLKAIVDRNTNDTLRAYGMPANYGKSQGIAKGAR